MSTVKHISSAGEESLHEARSVVYRPTGTRINEAHQLEPSPEADALEVYAPDGTCEVRYGGTIFVMNDLGKTVSRYDLGASEVPLAPIDPHLTAYIIRRERDGRSGVANMPPGI